MKKDTLKFLLLFMIVLVVSLLLYLLSNNQKEEIKLESFSIPDGEILLKTSDSYAIPITYIPSNANIENISYNVENDQIISVNNGIIRALSKGSTILTISINNTLKKDIRVNVTNNDVISHIIVPVKDLIINEDITINIDDRQKLNYEIEPINGIIYETNWESSHPNVVKVDELGTITGLESGKAIISLTINNRIKKEFNVFVKSNIESIKLDYIPKQIIKVGEQFTLYPTVSPSNQSKKIVYESSNSNVLSVNQEGIVTAKTTGNATITIRNEDNSVKYTQTFNVYENNGIVYSNTGIWAFSKETDVIPTKATDDFFIELAKNGKGIFNNNTYTYQKYSYDTRKNLLTIDNNRKIYMRIYYPKGKDLSTLNTFTFIGGIGETNFGGYFKNIESDASLIKSSGIIILIPENNSVKVHSDNVVEATNFVRLIINQNEHARNNIGGYSNGGPPVGQALNNGDYDRAIMINTSFYWINSYPNLYNKEFVIYTAINDTWRGTDSFIKELRNAGVKDITVITNSNAMADQFKDNYLIINPGDSMEKGHTSNNITLSHFFSYACD